MKTWRQSMNECPSHNGSCWSATLEWRFKSVPDLNTNANAFTYLSLYSLDGHLNLLKPNAISG